MLCAQWSKARANLFYKELRLFPSGIVPAFIERVVINKVVIGPLGPTPRRFIVLAGKDAYGSRDGDVGGVVEANLIFPIETSRRNRRVRQPIESDVVEHVISCKRSCGVSILRAPEHGRGDCRRRLCPTVTVVNKPGCQPDRRIRQSTQGLRARPHDLGVGASLRIQDLELLVSASFVARNTGWNRT